MPSNQYGKLTSTASGDSVQYNHPGGNFAVAQQAVGVATYTNVTVQYSLNDGLTWTTIDDGTTTAVFTTDGVRKIYMPACKLKVIRNGGTGTVIIVTDPV